MTRAPTASLTARSPGPTSSPAPRPSKSPSLPPVAELTLEEETPAAPSTVGTEEVDVAGMEEAGSGVDLDLSILVIFLSLVYLNHFEFNGRKEISFSKPVNSLEM